MAKLVYLREGTGPDRLTYGADLTLQDLILRLGERTGSYVGFTLPTLPTDRPDLTPFRDPSYVYIYVTSSEGMGDFSQQGYYLLEGVSPTEVGEWK